MGEKTFTTFADWWADRGIATSAAFFMPQLQPGMKLLDCGCGPGSITLDFAEVLAPIEVVGIDIDTRALERARRSAEERKLQNVKFIEGSIYDLQFEDASFDAVWTASTIQWLRSPRKALSEILRVLKPGGVYGSRDRCTEGDVFGNSNPIVRRAWKLHYRLNAQNGLSRTLAEKLRGMLLDAGFEQTVTSASYENRGGEGGGRWASQLYLSALKSNNFGGDMVRRGWTTDEDLARMIEAWETWGDDARSYYSICRLENVARKPA